MNLDEFYLDLQNEIIGFGNSSDFVNSFSCSFKENAFAQIVINDLSNDGIFESPTLAHIEFAKGNGIAKCSAYDYPEDESKLDLIIIDYYSESEMPKVNQQEVEKKLLQGYRFIETAFKKDGSEIFDQAHAQHMEMANIFHKKNNVDTINIVLITNALNVSRKISFARTLEGKDVTCEIFDLERYKRFREGGTRLDPIQINFSDYNIDSIPCINSVNENGFLTALMIFPGKLLYELYNQYRSRLLELNVRSYLQAKGKVNTGILKTLLTEPGKFLTYNNGITVVVESVDFNSDKTAIKGMKGIQIVNGGQTTASIHRAYKDSKAPLDNVFVQAKLTIVPSEMFEEVVPLISRYSNTQNPVSSVDLGANHPYHVGVERVAKLTWLPGQTSKWFYERARASYDTERSKHQGKPAQLRNFDIEYPKTNKMTKEEMARYSNLWLLLPHFVSKGGQKNFSKFMDIVGNNYKKDWEPSQEEYKDIIGLAIFCRSITRIAKTLDIPAYKVNIVNYTTSLIAYKTAKRIDRKKIWDLQTVSEAMNDLIVDWLQKVQILLLEIAENDFKGENIGEVFKKDKCWDVFVKKTESWRVSPSVESELTSVGGGGLELENDTASCMQLTADEWFSIAKWGSEKGLLETWQKGIASTLASYANDNWSKKPSEKQAKHGVSIIRLYRDSLSGIS